MRAVPLVRYWLYGFRGFVVMTISLAIAFSWAITGPPTNTEMDIVSEAVATRVAAFRDDIEAAAIEFCPSLPEELRMLCGGAPAPTATDEPQPAEAPPRPPPPVELAMTDTEAAPAAPNAELLGGPAQTRAPRAEPTRRAIRERASAQRQTRSRAAPPPRVTVERRTQPTRQRVAPDRTTAARIRAAQEAAQGDLTRGLGAPRRVEPPVAPPTQPIRRGENDLPDIERALAEYADYEAAEEAAYRRERAERGEERQRRWRERRDDEREYGGPYEDDYNDEPYPEEDYPDDVW